jgi:hypothetical protein
LESGLTYFFGRAFDGFLLRGSSGLFLHFSWVWEMELWQDFETETSGLAFFNFFDFFERDLFSFDVFDLDLDSYEDRYDFYDKLMDLLFNFVLLLLLLRLILF